MNRETIAITIDKAGTGFFVSSDDLPELNVFVRNAAGLTTAVPEAIKYLYRHNRNVEVMVFMEVPVLPTAQPKSVNIEPLQQAA